MGDTSQASWCTLKTKPSELVLDFSHNIQYCKIHARTLFWLLFIYLLMGGGIEIQKEVVNAKAVCGEKQAPHPIPTRDSPTSQI